jgi:tetratricopeptide (TPR) repeat protein
LNPLRPGLLQSATAAARAAKAELRFADALKAAARVAPAPSAAVELWRNLAQLLQNALSRPQEAREAWEEVLKVAPDDTQAIAAVQALVPREPVEAVPADPRARLEMEARRLEAQAADPRAAAEVYRQILELDPQDLTALKRLGAASAALEKWDDVAIVTLRLADLAPTPEERKEWRVRLAQVYSERLGRKEEAAALAMQISGMIADAHPEDAARSYSVLAGVFEDLGDRDRARELYELAAELLEPRAPNRFLIDVYSRLAEIAEAAGRKEEAYELMKKAMGMQKAVAEALP